MNSFLQKVWKYGFFGQNWTKSHDSSYKMKLFDNSEQDGMEKYYVILIFRQE